MGTKRILRLPYICSTITHLPQADWVLRWRLYVPSWSDAVFCNGGQEGHYAHSLWCCSSPPCPPPARATWGWSLSVVLSPRGSYQYRLFRFLACKQVLEHSFKEGSYWDELLVILGITKTFRGMFTSRLPCHVQNHNILLGIALA